MLKNIMGSTSKIDYLVIDVADDVDLESLLESKGYEVNDMSRDEYSQSVDDDYHLWFNSKHFYWNLDKVDEPSVDSMHNGLTTFDIILEGYRTVTVDPIDGTQNSVDIPISVDEGYGFGGYNIISLRSDQVHELGYDRLKKLMLDLEDVSTISRIDLAKDFYYKDKKHLNKQRDTIFKELIEVDDVDGKRVRHSYSGSLNQDNPITFTGCTRGVYYAYFIGDQNDPVNLTFYEPVRFGLHSSGEMLNKLKSYVYSAMEYRKPYDDDDNVTDEIIYRIEDALSNYTTNFFKQFNILRADMTLTGIVANEASKYILESEEPEEDVVENLLKTTSHYYFGF